MSEGAKTEREIIGEQLLFELDQNIMPFYMEHGCPCAFPRFRFLAEFDCAKFGVRTVGCHETLTIVPRYFQTTKSCYDCKADDDITCKICGSEYSSCYEDFSISFYLYTLTCRNFRATPVGADVGREFPLVFGLYGFNRDDVERIPAVTQAGFNSAGVRRFTEYMKELKV